MSIANPPIIVTSIYNPAFFEASATDTITQSQANALFLKKTTADTATALETFSAGIATNSLATTSLSSNLQIGSSTNTGTIFISTIATNNSNANPAISIGGDAGVKTIKINNGTNSVHCSSIDMAGSGINNVTNSTGNIDIGNLQTSGLLNIGANVGRLVDGIINIGTGSTVANPINIGSSTSLTSVGGTLGVTAGITTNKLNPLTSSSSLFIGDNSSSGTIAIKGTDGSTGTVAICDGPTTACTINLGSNACTTKIYGLQKLDTAATASCDIALTQTTGVLNIGTGARLITVPGNGVINIGTGSGAVVNPINIGSASSALNLNGSTIAIGNSFSTTTLNGVISFANLAIDSVDRATAGTLSLGTSIANLVNISRSTINTAVLGTLSVAEGISLPTPINLTYTTIPTYSSSQIGYRFQYNPANFTMTGTSTQNVYTFSSLPIGVYILQAQLLVNNTNYNVNFGFSATSATQDTSQITTSQGVAAGHVNLSTVWKQSTVSNIYVIISSTTIAYTLQYIYMTYTRIA